MKALELRGVEKSFKKRRGEVVCALDSVSLSVGKGEVVGILGRRLGAGIILPLGDDTCPLGEVPGVPTGAAGGVFTFHLGIIDPLFLDFYYMQTFLIIVIIGGAGSFWGVIAAGIALSALPEVLRFSADFRMIIYGVILVVAMFVMPTGVAGWLRERQLARLRESLQ